MMGKNRAWQNIFSSSKWGIMIVCSTASGGLFSGETCTAFVLTDAAAAGQNLRLWTKIKTSEELRRLLISPFPWLLCLPQSRKQPLAESMGIHLPCIGNPVLDGNLEFSINDEELALVGGEAEFPPEQYTHVPEPAADRRALWRLRIMKDLWLPLWYKILSWAHFGPMDQSADQRERQRLIHFVA